MPVGPGQDIEIQKLIMVSEHKAIPFGRNIICIHTGKRREELDFQQMFKLSSSKTIVWTKKFALQSIKLFFIISPQRKKRSCHLKTNKNHLKQNFPSIIFFNLVKIYNFQKIFYFFKYIAVT